MLGVAVRGARTGRTPGRGKGDSRPRAAGYEAPERRGVSGSIAAVQGREDRGGGCPRYDGRQPAAAHGGLRYRRLAPAVGPWRPRARVLREGRCAACPAERIRLGRRVLRAAPDGQMTVNGPALTENSADRRRRSR